ncbi:hypothetical protein C8R43DRAFT_1124738 [Mycena crocata]|nr:hypothetical protein C8R43DRAFT_1124738 [Mycena crocata]
MAPTSKKSKGPQIGGLRAEYKRGRTSTSSTLSQRSKSVASAMSIDASSGNESVPASEYQDSSEGIGGIDSGDDDNEEAADARRHNQEPAGRFENLSALHSLAGIVETDAPGLVPLRPSKSESRLKKADIRLSHLPLSTQPDFGTVYTRDLLLYIATLPPWASLEGWQELAEIWDPLFPLYPLASNHSLQVIVLKLSEDKIAAYRNGYSTAAVKALEDLYAAWEAYSPEDRASVVECLQRGDDESRAFYYREYDDEGEVVVRKGLFQGFLVTACLATHYAAIRTATSPIETPDASDPPETPLVYSIQAVKRALNYSVTGTLVVPGQRLGEFSKANWGDRMVYREGRQVVDDPTSRILDVVRELQNKSPVIWEKIMGAAIEASLPKRRPGIKVEAADVAAKPKRVIELVDDDSDIADWCVSRLLGRIQIDSMVLIQIYLVCML